MVGRQESGGARTWARWQDWTTLALGGAALCSPLYAEMSRPSDPEAVLTVLGLLLAITSLASLGAPESVSFEWLHGVLGALLAVAPWFVGFTDNAAAAWLSWICGTLTVIVAATALPMARMAHRADAASRATVRALVRRHDGWTY